MGIMTIKNLSQMKLDKLKDEDFEGDVELKKLAGAIKKAKSLHRRFSLSKLRLQFPEETNDMAETKTSFNVKDDSAGKQLL